jgi:hypothetical protein
VLDRLAASVRAGEVNEPRREGARGKRSR